MIISEIEKLKEILLKLGSVLVAYSGGLDSTLLLRVAKDVLGPESAAIIASGPLFQQWETEAAEARARNLGVRYRLVPFDMLEHPEFQANSPDRCYHCKRLMYGEFLKAANVWNLAYVVDGAQASDLEDDRPGQRASRELDVRSPMKEAGLSKKQIASASKALGLDTWDKPSEACLATRIPFGMPVRPSAIARIARCEALLHAFGIRQARVRYHHNDMARIEISPRDFDRILDQRVRTRLLGEFKSTGFRRVSLDLEGYRSGSMKQVPDTRCRTTHE
ncbi:MAG: ATP-dependent sacrificial sulfur transferase LarE [Desulfobacterales bacterium]|nr:ATP-dependent sacrificial sulfur transferase LarE [Desulfobacterales bacterium]